MSDIPKAVELLRAAQLLIDQALGNMSREKVSRRSPARSIRMTKELGDQIRLTAKKNPDLPMQDIANYYGVNAGRVSEALKGKWK